MVMVQGARAAVIRAGIPASLFRALPASASLVKLPVVCRSSSSAVSKSSSATFSFNSASRLSDSRGRFGVIIFCAPSSSAASSVAVDSPSPEPAAPAAADVGADSDLLDIRVGKILKAWKHPEADAFYVDEVDVGEPEGPRTICSGLVKYILQEAFEARNMRRVKSNGMLLCASDAAHENVELLGPPEGAVPGERIWLGSEEDKASQKSPAAPNQVQKKIWKSIQPLLKTTDD